MALLGNGGILELSREWPEPMALTLDAINGNTIALGNEDYWTGDRILFTAASGIPFDLNGDGYADCPEGHGIYRGSKYELGPARDFYTGPETNENGPHYRTESLALSPAAVNYTTTPNTLVISSANFFTGERVYLASAAGLPIDLNGDGYADLPEGHGVYAGSQWDLSPARAHVASASSNYYTPNDAIAFYVTASTTGLSTLLEAYIVKDVNNNVRFYDSPSPGATEYVIRSVAPGNFVIFKYRDTAGYVAAVEAAAVAVADLDLATEDALENVITLPSVLSFNYYNRNQDTGFATQFDAYGSMDQLGRIRLFTSELGAHNNETSAALALRSVDCGNFIVSRYSANSTYTAALNTAANSIRPLSLPSDSQELAEVITPPAGLAAIANDPDQRGWPFQADLQEWALDIDAANLDMTAIGETFGEHTKALVRGAGTLQFLVDHKTSYQGQDTTAVLRLVLLTQQYCKTAAKFYLYKDRGSNQGQIAGKMYYECDILLTNSKINIRFDDVITGSADFVATGEVGLKVSP